MVYLSLGSNIGNRLEYLQLAIGLIAYRIGPIKSISSVYETPAWGFESTPFLNLCLGLTTAFPPEMLLDELLQIEQQLGRTREDREGYSARTIDLDILFYDAVVCDTPKVAIPHPRMHQRRFILHPLCEIAKNQFHPTLMKPVAALEKECSDPAVLQLLPVKIKYPRVFSFIAIEGTIGIGKTTLTKKLNALLGGTLLLENFLDNPYLEDFYADPVAYALLVETAFLHERVAHYHRFFSHDQKHPIIADFTLGKSLLFAKVNLTAADYVHYAEEFISQTKELPPPDLVLLLHQNLDGIMKKINQRGRAFEKNISMDYLRTLNSAYTQEGIHPSIPKIAYALDGIDLIEDPNALYPILLKIFTA